VGDVTLIRTAFAGAAHASGVEACANPAGALLDLASHQVDLLWFLFDAESSR
jgi:predicted dehydrogenase